MGGGILLQKKTGLLQLEFIWHLILLCTIASLASCDQILEIIAAAFGYWNDVIDCVRIHSAPVTFPQVSLQYTQSNLFPMRAVGFTL